MRNLACLLALIVSFLLFSSTLGEFNVKCNSISAKSAIARLYRHINCDLYNRVGNTRHEHFLQRIGLMIRPEILNFNEFDNNLAFDGVFVTTWTDPHLKWNYTEYDYIRAMMVNSRAIWTPDIAILSAGNDNADEHGPIDTRCRLHYNGKIWCLHTGRRYIRCQTDYTDWPYDRQNCTMVITSWAYSSKEIYLSLIVNTMSMYRLRSNGEWKYTLARISYGARESNYYDKVSTSQIMVDFVLDRMRTHFRGRYVAPAIIMMVVTMTTVWLDPKSMERLAIASLNIIIHILCIQDLHWALPHNGTAVPNLLLFYANSLVLATVALVLTFLLRKIKDTKLSAPKWISSSTALILRSKAGQYLLLCKVDPKRAGEIETGAGDNEVLTSTEQKETAWTYVVILIGWITFIGFLFTYMTMYAVLIPSSAEKPSVKVVNYDDRVDDQFGVLGA